MKHKRTNTIFEFVVFCFLAIGFPVCTLASVGVSEFSETGYIEFIPGNIPVVISVPHGGREILSSQYIICGEHTTDPYTDELALKIKDAFYQRWNGACPYIIINHLRRNYLDANRDPGIKNREKDLIHEDPENPETPDTDIMLNPADPYPLVCTGSVNVWTALVAKRAWYEYNDFIDFAKADVGAKLDAMNPGNNGGLYIDLHSHTHSNYNVELGYLIPLDAYSENGNLDIQQSHSSFKFLDFIPENANDTFSNLIVGERSFGAILEKYTPNYTYIDQTQCIPGPDLLPEDEPDYFGGGWDTFYHTFADYRNDRTPKIDDPYSYDYLSGTEKAGHKKVSGFQLEIPSNYLCNVWLVRKPQTMTNLANALADSIDEYLITNYSYNIQTKLP